MNPTKIASLTLLAAVGSFAQPVLADDYFSPTDERVRISLGVEHLSSSTTLQVDGSEGVTGTSISGEDEFGLSKSDWEPKFQALVRVDTRQRLGFDYFTLDRSGNSTVGATPIVFRDVTFLPDDPLQTHLSIRTFGISYEYSFWHSETVELAAMVGVHATDISVSAKVQTQTRHVVQDEDQAGPVPTVGLDGTWVISERFYVDARGQYLNVHVNNLSGSLGIYDFEGLYRFRPNVSFGLGYTDIKAHLTSAQSTQPGTFQFNTNGPELFFRISF